MNQEDYKKAKELSARVAGLSGSRKPTPKPTKPKDLSFLHTLPYTKTKPVSGLDGKDGKDGKDASEISPLEIANKLNTTKGSIDSTVIRGLPNLDAIVKDIKDNKRLELRDIKGARLDMRDQRWHGGAPALAAGSGITITTSTTDGTKTISSTGGSGTVTSVSVTTANGVSGSVATATTTPAITLTLGAITPSAVQVSGLTASEIVLTDGSKNLVSAAVATYPSLTELTYLKGVTSAIQTQINAKGAGTVTTVGFTGGLISVANATTTPALTVAGTSGGVPYFSSTSAWASSALLAANALMIGGGAGTAPATTTTGTGVLTALGVNVGSAGAFVTFNGALGTPSSGTVTNLTGTASININGTVGATSATTATFTTATINTSLLPDANDGAVLGAAGTAFSDLFLAEGAVINWDSSDATITQTGNVLAVAGADFRIATADVGTNADSVPTLSSTNTFTNKTLPSPTLTTPSAFTTGGSITLAENTTIILDPVLSADEKWTGITIAGTLGATIAIGDLVYLSASDSRWELADADAASTSGDVPLAICLVAGNDGSATTLLTYGNIRSAAFPAFTVGAPYYVSTTAGDITTTQPSGTDDVIRRVGFALSADDLLFNPSNDYITHT